VSSGFFRILFETFESLRALNGCRLSRAANAAKLNFRLALEGTSLWSIFASPVDTRREWKVPFS
jgi:hypothetical protein